MLRRVWVVQHGEKEPTPGDPGLTATGHHQARATARWFASHAPPSVVWTSPLRRAVETATPIAEMAGVDLRVEPRLRERMNWEGPEVQPLEVFLHDWQRATRDRAWRPPGGESSAEAGARFLDVLSDVAASPTHTDVAVVSHGGVTVDALRDLLGDDEVQVRAPRLLDDGVAPCAITELVLEEGGWSARTIGSVAHLASASPPSSATRPPRPRRS